MTILAQKFEEYEKALENFQALEPLQIQLNNIDRLGDKTLTQRSKTAFLNKFGYLIEAVNNKVANILGVDIAGDEAEVTPLGLVVSFYENLPNRVTTNQRNPTDMDLIQMGIASIGNSISQIVYFDNSNISKTPIQNAILDRLFQTQRRLIDQFAELLLLQEDDDRRQAELAQIKEENRQQRKRKQQQVEPPPPPQDVDFVLTPPTEPPPKAPKSGSKAFYGIVGSFGRIVQPVEAYEKSSNADSTVVSALNKISVSKSYSKNASVELSTLISNLSVVMQSYGLQGIVEVNAFPSFTGALDVLVDDSPTSSSDYSVSIDSTLNSDGEYEDSIIEEIAIGIFQYLNLVNPQIEEVGLSELDLAFMLKGQI